jgi:hypothetical protein
VPFGWGPKDKPEPPDASALDAFERALPADPGSSGPVAWTDRDTRALLGRDLPLFTVFMAERVRSSVGGGLLRFLTPDTHPSLTGWNARNGWRSDWPSAPSSVAFASDWLGRLYLLSTDKQTRNGEPVVLVLDHATAAIEPVDVTFGEFLGKGLAGNPRVALDADRLDEWVASGGQVPPPDQCVAPKMPLFLGGSDAIGDLSMTFLVVVVSFAGQAWEQVRNLPPGTRISGVKMG